jgi:hypothetical protein
MVESAGFKRAERTELTLQVNQSARIEIVMEVGSVNETVNVTATAALIDATTSAVGHVIDKQSILNLPLNQRNPFALILLVPGANGSVGTDMFGGNFAVNGGRNGANEILLDGVPSAPPSDNSNRLTVFPSVDAVEEFRVQTNNFSAEFGNSGGGLVNVIYKSGSNNLHGSFFEFLRNSKMDSNNFFSNAKNIPLSSFKRNQFGASAGGPVEIPKLYNGRNKTFFFLDYEGLRQRSAANLLTSVPTALQRAGDFSQTLTATGQLITIYDPTTTIRSGSGYARSPVPGNLIPASLIDPVARNVVRFWPLPNSQGAAFTNVNNFAASSTSPTNINQYDVKVDQNLNDRQRLFVRFSRRYLETDPANYFPADIRVAQGGTIGTQTSSNVVFNYDLTRSPSFLINFRYGFARNLRWTSTTSDGYDPTQLGLPSYIRDNADTLVMPTFAPAGYYSIGNGSTLGIGPLSVNVHSWQLGNTRVLTSHVIKFGGDLRLYRNDTRQGGYATGEYDFARSFTQGPDPVRATSNAGDGFASFLFGVGSGRMDRAFKTASTQSTYYAPYVSDDWKLTSKLTLNLGFRWDLNVPRTERFNRANFIDPFVPSPLSGPSGIPKLAGGLVFVGVNGVDRKQFNTEWGDFAPRFGFAYQANGKTVFRGAYGIFWAPPSSTAAQTIRMTGFSSSTPYQGTLDGVTPTAFLRNPFPNGYLPISGSSLGLMTFVGQSVSAPLRDTRNPYLENWNFGIQRELRGGLLVEIAYVGSRGLQLTRSVALDQLRSQYLALGAQLLQPVTNPFYGLISSGVLSTPTIQQRYLLRDYPQFDGFSPSSPAGGSSTYQSLQLKVEKRFSSGLGLLLAYTNSKLIDDSSQDNGNYGRSVSTQDSFNPRGERSISPNDVSQRLVISYVYDLPLGRARSLGRNWNRLTDTLLGGWQVNGITTFQRGVPLALSTQNTSNAFNGGLRPNNSGKSAKLGGSVNQRLNGYLDASVFSLPAPFTFGNTSRTLPDVRADGSRNFDLSLFKNFRIKEGWTLQFRAESFNVFNTPQFGIPNQDISSVSFGVISSTANSPRQMQFELKFLY